MRWLAPLVCVLAATPASATRVRVETGGTILIVRPTDRGFSVQRSARFRGPQRNLRPQTDTTVRMGQSRLRVLADGGRVKLQRTDEQSIKPRDLVARYRRSDSRLRLDLQKDGSLDQALLLAADVAFESRLVLMVGSLRPHLELLSGELSSGRRRAHQDLADAQGLTLTQMSRYRYHLTAGDPAFTFERLGETVRVRARLHVYPGDSVSVKSVWDQAQVDLSVQPL